MSFQLLSVFVLISISSITAVYGVQKSQFDNKTINWSELENIVQKVTGKIPRPSLFQLYRMSRDMDLSSDCEASLLQTLSAVAKMKSWAVHMLDASGKIPSGILDGTVMDFGSYEECLKIRVRDPSTGKEDFRGRYCMVGYSSPLIVPIPPNSTEEKIYIEKYGIPPDWIAKELVKSGGYLKLVAFWLGTCVPSTCSQQDLSRLLSYVVKPVGMTVRIADCQIDEEEQWPMYALVSVCVLSVFAGFLIVGTLIDVIIRINPYFYHTEYCALKLLKMFSLLSNTERLFCNIPDSGRLGCFHGIRFFSATWIVLGHTYFFTDTWKYLKYRNLLGLTKVFNRHLPLAVIENFTIPVGSFFFMSGFLLVYSTVKKLDRSNGRINIIMFFIHKYWRMTPALGLMITMLMAMPLISSGPLWKSTLAPPIDACRRHWWTNMLYINNWWNSQDFCIIHTWYLAALMQFHLIGLLVMIITYRWPFIGTSLGLLISLSSCFITALVAYWNNFPMPAPAIIKDMDIVHSYNDKIYVKTFNHTVTYFMGMMTAYIVLKYKQPRLSVTCQIVGWVLAIAGALSSVYGLYGPAESVFIRAFYIGFHRIGWTFGVSWLAYTCIVGYGGMINRILSWKVFVPLGNLSYLVYLLHPLVILFRTASLRERVYYGNIDMVFEYLAYTIISFFMAFIGYVAVEMPFASLEGMIFKSNSVNLTKTCDAKDPGTVTTQSVKTIVP